jgi:hypothetical protein
VIPVHISGTRYTKHPLAAYFVRHKSRVRFGRPIDLSAYYGRERDRAVLREVTELIIRSIERLPLEPPADALQPLSPGAAATAQ